MAHTFTDLLVHATFSTKGRMPVLDKQVGPRVFAYMGGIVRELGGKAFAINGPADHVHLQMRLPRRSFAWQTGYGAFSVSESSRDSVTAYVEEQQAHHRQVDFRAEFEALLRRHGIAYDETHLWT